MASTTRTFVGVAVPEALEPKLTRLQSQLAGEVPEARWTVTMPFHVTLAFLGDVDNTDLNALCRAVAEASAPFGPFELKLEGLGAFPDPARPRVVWSRVGITGLGTLNALQSEIAGAVARMRYPVESRPFHAHVTLGRFGPGRRPSRDLSTLLSHYKTWYAGPFAVTEAVVFASTPGRDAVAYAPLGRAPLRGRNPEASP